MADSADRKNQYQMNCTGNIAALLSEKAEPVPESFLVPKIPKKIPKNMLVKRIARLLHFESSIPRKPFI
ncbi:MAG: hypothetical protein ACI4ET_10890 [Bilifractor sp.]